MGRRLGAILIVMSLGATVLTTGASARPSAVPSRGLPAALARTERVGRLPWRSGGAQVIPHQVVVVWRGSTSLAQQRRAVADLGTERVEPTPGLGVDVVRVPAGRSVSATIRAFQRSPLVRSAEPNRIAEPTAAPTDPLFKDQWALDNTGQAHPLSAYPPDFPFGETAHGTAGADVHALDAWATPQLGDPSAVIAVLDTGVDTSNPDLTGQFVPGRDFVDHDNDPTPSNGLENSHGTHVAGIIAAKQDGSVGISGICPGCKIMPLRIGTKAGLSLGDELKAIDFAIANGARIINMSFGSPIWSKSERAAIAKAGRHDILVVAAAGNSSMDNDIQFYDHLRAGSYAPSYPAAYSLPNIITVAASNDRDQYAYVSQCRGSGIPLFLCGFTNWGHDSVDVAAPGVDILSTVKVGQGPSAGVDPNYDVWDGTSMAAPMVAGIAGLVLSQNPSDSAIQLKNAIMNSVDRPSSLKLYTAWAKETKVGKKLLSGKFTRTNGRVDAAAALSASTTNATPKTDGNIDGARPIRKRRTDAVSWPADANDVYEKRLTKGATYHIALDGPKGKDFDLWVWRPGTKEIFQFTAGCFQRIAACPALEAFSAGNTADEAVTFKASRSGVFYIQVNGWYSGGRYSLTVKKV